MQIRKEISTTYHCYTGNHYDGRRIVHIKEYFYDSEEEREKHRKEMIANGYLADSQVKEMVGSFFDPEYVWFGRYTKIEIQKEIKN